jgi:excisionase family DNA binding protein
VPATATTVDRIAYSPAELADALGASRAWVYLRLDDGTIPSVKLGGKRLIRATVLEEILAAGEVTAHDVA